MVTAHRGDDLFELKTVNVNFNSENVNTSFCCPY